jgi:hypothetical protein
MNICRFIPIFLVLLLACRPAATALPDAQPTTPAPSPASTATRAVLSSPTASPEPAPTSTPELPKQLPSSLYFRYDPKGNSQVWRLEVDSVTFSQITHEEGMVDSFSVSLADGAVAYITQNKLFMVDREGQNRRLLADDSKLPEDRQGTYEYGWMSSVALSPDGRRVAYGLDGLHLLDLDTGEDRLLLENMGNMLGEPFIFSKELYAPVSWSPDGSMLLFSMAYFEGSTLGIYEPGAPQPFRRLRSSEPVQGSFTWTADSRSVLVANPNYGTSAPGLWSFNAKTGEETLILGGFQPDSPMTFVASPFRLASGDLLSFYYQVERINPDIGIPTKMMHISADGLYITEVRPEEFHGSALWAPDGSLVVHSGRCCGQEHKQLVLVRPDKSPVQVLLEPGDYYVLSLTWGP